MGREPSSDQVLSIVSKNIRQLPPAQVGAGELCFRRQSMEKEPNVLPTFVVQPASEQQLQSERSAEQQNSGLENHGTQSDTPDIGQESGTASEESLSEPSTADDLAEACVFEPPAKPLTLHEALEEARMLQLAPPKSKTPAPAPTTAETSMIQESATTAESEDANRAGAPDDAPESDAVEELSSEMAADDEDAPLVDPTILDTLRREVEIFIQMTHLFLMQIENIRKTAGPGSALLGTKFLQALTTMEDRIGRVHAVSDMAIKRTKPTSTGKIMPVAPRRRGPRINKTDEAPAATAPEVGVIPPQTVVPEGEEPDPTIGFLAKQSSLVQTVSTGPSKNGPARRQKHRLTRPKKRKRDGSSRDESPESVSKMLARVRKKYPASKSFDPAAYDGRPDYLDFRARLVQVSVEDDTEARELYHRLSGIRVDRLNQFGLGRARLGTVTKTINHLKKKQIETAAQLILSSADELVRPVAIDYKGKTNCGATGLTLIRHWLVSIGVSLAGETYAQACAQVREDEKRLRKISERRSPRKEEGAEGEDEDPDETDEE